MIGAYVCGWIVWQPSSIALAASSPFMVRQIGPVHTVVPATSTDGQDLPQTSRHPPTRSVYNNFTTLREVINSTTGHSGLDLSFSTPALGFAFNLSYTIIRDTQEDDNRSRHSDESADTTIGITYEGLVLSVHHEPREDCSAASRTSPQERGQRARPDWIYSLSSKKGTTICSRSTSTPLIDSV